MNDLLYCESVYLHDREFVERVGSLVFSVYDGRGPDWQLSDNDELWKIQFGNVSAVLGVCLNERKACVKLFYDKRLHSRIRNLLNQSKAKRAYCNGKRLVEKGIPCPAMIGYVRNRETGICLIITDLADDFERIDQWIFQHGADDEMVAALGEFIRSMHDAGVRHSDLSPRNILFRHRPSNGGCDFILLDFEDVSFTDRDSSRGRCDNLFHLYERLYKLLPAEQHEIFIGAYGKDDVEYWHAKMKKCIKRKPSKYTREAG